MMKNYIWYDRHCKHAYDRLAEEVTRQRVNVNLGHPYLDEICNETKSARITDLIVRAYYLGRARAIKDINEGYTPVSMS